MTNTQDNLSEIAKIQSGVVEFYKFVIELASQEGKKFKEKNGREPTEAEAQEMVEMIVRQTKTALVLNGGKLI